MIHRKVHELTDKELDDVISSLSIEAQKALRRGKVSDELHRKGLVSFGRGVSDLGARVRDRILNRKK